MSSEFYDENVWRKAEDATFFFEVATGTTVLYSLYRFIASMSRSVNYGNLTEDVILYRARHKTVKNSYASEKFFLNDKIKFVDIRGDAAQFDFIRSSKLSLMNILTTPETKDLALFNEQLVENFNIEMTRIPKGTFVKVVADINDNVRDLTLQDSTKLEGKLAYVAKRMGRSKLIWTGIVVSAVLGLHMKSCIARLNAE